MKRLQEHIQILFGQVPPEYLIRELHRYTDTPLHKGNELKIDKTAYCTYAKSAFPQLSNEEINQKFKYYDHYCQRNQYNGALSTLADWANKMLVLDGDRPVCRQECHHWWRDVSFLLGEDILTTAYLAREDVADGYRTTRFNWATQVGTNNWDLNQIINQGLAENHFHLYGSTQIFHIAWSFLMNHPQYAKKYFEAFEKNENLHSTIVWTSKDNLLDWHELIYLACWIRIRLFDHSMKIDEDFTALAMTRFQNDGCKTTDIQQSVSEYRFLYGGRCNQASRGNGHDGVCLDYALTQEILEKNNNSVRLLAGERSLLYHSFRSIYCDKFTSEQKYLFYLYLLLKQRFRNEIIQTNHRFGFGNFSQYQDRKNVLWESHEAYWKESVYLSICTAAEQHVQSLEVRISPALTKSSWLRKINELKNATAYAMSQQEPAPAFELFATVHFIKSLSPEPVVTENQYDCKPRKYAERRLAQKAALSLGKILRERAEAVEYIRGIDAASHEIGCRPETFATEFRYLKKYQRKSLDSSYMATKKPYPKLGRTYHVGEDFLDIVDGLRAIDETISFLDFERGNRLGHALALGIWPEDFYPLKGDVVHLPAQDLLDNLVWIIYRCAEWGIEIPSLLKNQIKVQANDLFREIYDFDGENHWDLRDYYFSWMLRGDHPDLYENTTESEVCKYFEQQLNERRGHASLYRKTQITPEFSELYRLSDQRKKKAVLVLLWRYHFSPRVRCRGDAACEWVITSDYIKLVESIQNHMIALLAEKGISIECNLSSNHLIGTFRDDTRHPIFRFNHYKLPMLNDRMTSSILNVSLNTDDLGVFDTSLANEYALLYSALRQMTDADGNRLVCDPMCYEYIQSLRNSGFQMSFNRISSR